MAGLVGGEEHHDGRDFRSVAEPTYGNPFRDLVAGAVALVQFRLFVVDCDNMRTALGQKPYGRGANDAGGAGDDGDPAIETNAIVHAWRFPGWSGYSGFCGPGAWRTSRYGGIISFAVRADQWPTALASRPFPAVFDMLTGGLRAAIAYTMS
jgi:hypothetical protein